MTFRPTFTQEHKAQARSGCMVTAVILSLLGLAVIALLILLGVWWAKRKPQPSPVPQPSGDELRVHVLDVGQGDSILIIAPGGKSVLVDAGTPGSGKVVSEAMRRSRLSCRCWAWRS